MSTLSISRESSTRPDSQSLSPQVAPWAVPILREVARRARTWFDTDGYWATNVAPEQWGRDRLWLCDGIYPLDPQLCDAIALRHTTPNFRDHRFSVFTSNIAAVVLAHHREIMGAATRLDLESLVRESFHFKPGNRQPDYQFHGYNDNFPAMATMGLCVGGDMFDDAGALEYGRWNLRQLRAMLVRRGTISEFNSPTYYSIVIHSMAAIVEYCRDEEIRELARGIEHRLWIDFAARFHPSVGLLSGPYSRSYNPDNSGTGSMGTMMLWCVFGDALNIQPSPALLIDPPPDYGGTLVHNFPYELAKLCFFASMRYHVPETARRLFFEKKYPYRAIASAETGSGGDAFPARQCRLETYQREDYSLGTNDTPMLGGQQDTSYFVTYRRKEKVESFRDAGTVFHSIVINDQVPGQPAKVDPKYLNRGEEVTWHNFANTIVLQSDSTALVLSHPDLGWGGSDNPMPWHQREAKPIHTLSEMAIFPSHYADADEILGGGAKRDAWTGTVDHGQWIACRRGRLLIAIRPMAYTRTMGRAAVTLERINDYDVIRATFYCGEPRAFSIDELRNTYGGFVAEHASVDDFPSPSAFASYLAAAKFTDYYWQTRRVRYRRPAGAGLPALDMEISYPVGATQVRYATINGVIPECPRAKIDGVKESELPFLNEPFTPVPGFFPWKDFTVEWADWPWAINDRE